MAQTRTDIGIGKGLYDVSPKEQAQKDTKEACEARGGSWINGTCLMYQKPAEKPAPATAPPVKLTTPEIFRDEETGKLSGISLPNGNQFAGISPKDVKAFAQDFQENTTLPSGTQPAGTAQAQADRQARLAQLMQMGQQGLLSQEELNAIQQAPIDWGQALTAGSVGNLPSVLTRTAGGAAAGAAAGGLLGLGIGAVPGAVIGGIGGFISAMWGGTQANIKRQQSGEIAKTKDVLSAAKTNMRALSLIASKDPSKAEEAVTLYYQQLAQVHKAYRKLQAETQGNLNKYLDDGTEDLSDFELFLQPGGYADIQLTRLQQAVIGKQQISDEELLQFYQEEFSDVPQ